MTAGWRQDDPWGPTTVERAYTTRRDEARLELIETKRRLPGERDRSDASAAFMWGHMRLWEGGGCNHKNRQEVSQTNDIAHSNINHMALLRGFKGN